MGEFLPQFWAVTWRLWAIIFAMFVIAGFAYWRMAKQNREDIARRKEDIRSDLKSKDHAKKKKADSVINPDPASIFPDDDYEDDFVVAPQGGSIFDDDDLFPGDDDDPLAEIYAARQEAQQEQHEDIVELASLLTGMAEEVEEPKDYHLVAEQPVAVKLDTERHAIGRELLSILRDERDSRLMVQLADKAYRTLGNDADARKEFATVMKELSSIILSPDESPPEDADVTALDFNKMSSKAVDVQISSGGDTTAREMISVLRDEADGHLIIQIGNTGYRTLTDNPKAKSGFSKIMKELSTAVTTPDDNPPIVPRKAKPAPAPEPVTSGSIFADEESEVDHVMLPGDIRPPKMDDLPDAYDVDRFGRVKVKKIKMEDKVRDINIADAIEAYLQHKIEQTPEFRNRGIHIRSAFGGGVKIEVDGATYEFVDEVADPAAREFIQTAINEWQERH